MQRFEASIDELCLDLKNPRIGSVQTQSQALAAIIKLNSDHFKTMMRSIKDHGLDPGDSFYVYPDESDPSMYVVLDGNRRLSALKVLSEPAALQVLGLEPSIVKQLSKIATGFDASQTEALDCVLFESRDLANDWIERRHGRDLDGEGRIPWGPLEIQRFQNDWLAIHVIEFVERNSRFTDQDWPEIKAAAYNNSSTLRRFLESPSFQKLVDLDYVTFEDGRVPAFREAPEFVADVLSALFQDLANGKVNSRTHNKAVEIHEYIENLSGSVTSKRGLGALKEFRSTTLKGKGRPRNSAAKTSTNDKSKKGKIKPKRATLAPKLHKFVAPAAEKGQQLLREAGTVRLEDAPLACAFVLRAFLEHTVDSYMHNNKLPFWEGGKQLELSKRATRVLDHIHKNGVAEYKAHLKGVKRTLTSNSDPASIHALNDYHHNKYQVPAVDVLRDAWDSAEPLFICVYGKS